MGQRPQASKHIAAVMLGAIALLALEPAPAHASWWKGDWAARKSITIDTSSAGANITDPIGTTPC